MDDGFLLRCLVWHCSPLGALCWIQHGRGHCVDDQEVNPGIFIHKAQQGKTASVSLTGNSQQPLCTIPATWALRASLWTVFVSLISSEAMAFKRYWNKKSTVCERVNAMLAETRAGRFAQADLVFNKRGGYEIGRRHAERCSSGVGGDVTGQRHKIQQSRLNSHQYWLVD